MVDWLRHSRDKANEDDGRVDDGRMKGISRGVPSATERKEQQRDNKYTSHVCVCVCEKVRGEFPSQPWPYGLQIDKSGGGTFFVNGYRGSGLITKQQVEEHVDITASQDNGVHEA